jgi:membrane peptidoglycan carboxypeptidase
MSYSRARRARRRRQRGADVRFLFLGLFLTTALVVGVAIPSAVAQAAGDLPSVNGISPAQLDQDILIYDRNGELLADVGAGGDHRIVTPLDTMSPNLVNATVAIEDRTFYKNPGVDVGGILRAGWADYTHHSIRQGGSTITQQLVKQVILKNDAHTLERKAKEAYLALEVNNHYRKREILGMYLNTIYYGNQSYGAEAAATSLFHIHAHDLDLAQSAMLAGLPAAPTRFNPVLNPPAAKGRQLAVLQAMTEAKLITRAQAEQAAAEKLQVFPATNQFKAPHFVDYVLRHLSAKHAIKVSDRRGYYVRTTLDLRLQEMAERAVREHVSELNAYNITDGALVSLDPKTGEILAMVGGLDYHEHGGQYNMTVEPRQPGSSFKIFTYTAAITSRRMNATSPILDAPFERPRGAGDKGEKPWKVTNYSMRYRGVMPLKLAFGNSMNIPAVKTVIYIGIPEVLATARKMGVTALDQPDEFYGPSLTLGGYNIPLIQLATGAATLADMGTRHDPQPILRIEDARQHKIFQYEVAKNAAAVIEPHVAFIVANIMSDDRNRYLEFGANGALTLPGRRVAAKTGTTENFRDNLTVGFTPELVTAVWVGNTNNAPMARGATGITGAAPIWHRFMEEALAGRAATWYAPPAGLVRIGDDYYLPDSLGVPSPLARELPRCPSRPAWEPVPLLVNGLPCNSAPKPPEPKPEEPKPSPPPPPREHD